MELAPLRLKKNEDRRLRAGHLWVFSNEVDVAQTPLTAFAAGQAVRIESHSGQTIGVGYTNPHSLICARLVGRGGAHPLDRSLLTHRLNVALSLRTRLFDAPYYRLVHGEGDLLPGLVVDRYSDVLVAQITTAGMEQLKDDIVAALEKVLRPRAILWRNDSSIRELEHLDRYVEPALGEVPDEVSLEENGVTFTAPLRAGQKTGWYYDHRLNRARMQRYVKDASVLDLFSYIGAWGIQAASAGARQVLCVDNSRPALEALGANAARNGVGERVETMAGDAFEVLKALREERRRFDVVILDPPAFIKRKKDLKEGVLAYRRLNQMAMQVLERDGLLISASCSHHLPREELRNQMLQAARHIDREMQVIEQGHQGPDHPIHPAIPETEYLKTFLARVLPA